jgi:flagellar protein FliO/FliZ
MAVNPAQQHAATISVALIFVVAVIYLLAFLIKKFKNNSLLNKDLKIESVMHLSNKVKLMIVRVADQKILLGVTGDSVNKLCDLKKDDEYKC